MKAKSPRTATPEAAASTRKPKAKPGKVKTGVRGGPTAVERAGSTAYTSPTSSLSLNFTHATGGGGGAG